MRPVIWGKRGCIRGVRRRGGEFKESGVGCGFRGRRTQVAVGGLPHKGEARQLAMQGYRWWIEGVRGKRGGFKDAGGGLRVRGAQVDGREPPHKGEAIQLSMQG
jgi:hypothetical protein